MTFEKGSNKAGLDVCNQEFDEERQIDIQQIKYLIIL